MVKRTLTPLPKTVKETVDFIYEFLIVHPDGVQFSAGSLGGSTQKRILCILVKRGIVERTWLLTGGTGRVCKYKWIATMPPTKTLYGSIVTEIRDEQKAWPSHKKSAKSKQSVKEQSVVDEKQDAVIDAVAQEPIGVDPTSVFAGFGPFDGFSDQELWDELKKRGYSIEGNRLVIVKKTYLD